MPIVHPTYILDPSGSLWQLAADNTGLLTTTAVVSGAPVYTGIFLNDILVDLGIIHHAQTWRLYVGADGLLRDTAVAPRPAPSHIVVNSPNQNLWKVQIADGLLMTSPTTDTCLPMIGGLYIPNWNNIGWQQPFGLGTTVFPQQNTGSFGYPVPGITMQEPGQGLWTAGCGHWFDEFQIFRDVNNCTNQSAAIQCCPVCTYVIRTYSPYEIIFDPVQYAILV